MGKNLSEREDIKESYLRNHNIRLKEKVDIKAIKKAGRLVVDTLLLVEQYIKPGVKTDEINALVHEFTLKHGATPAALNYRGFPKSVCISVNEEICSGCGLCISVCPFSAIDLEDGKAKLNEALCKGCGSCVAVCPSGAMEQKGFKSNQLYAMIDVYSD